MFLQKLKKKFYYYKYAFHINPIDLMITDFNDSLENNSHFIINRDSFNSFKTSITRFETSDHDDQLGFTLMFACDKRNTPFIKFLLNHGANIHFQNEYPLRKMASTGDLNIIKFLIKHDANIHSKDNYILFQACINNHLDVVHFLVESGINIDENYYAFKATAQEGHIEIVKYLLEQGFDFNFLKQEQGLSYDVLKLIETKDLYEKIKDSTNNKEVIHKDYQDNNTNSRPVKKNKI